MKAYDRFCLVKLTCMLSVCAPLAAQAPSLILPCVLFDGDNMMTCLQKAVTERG